jgi:hypothetical protein
VIILVILLAGILMSVAAQSLPEAGMSSSAVREVLTKPFHSHSLVVVLTNTSAFGGLALCPCSVVVWPACLRRWM